MLSNIVRMEDILNTLDILNKIYDSVRIINPLRKKVLSIYEGVLSETGLNCYDFWSKGSACHNCISMRAFKEKDTFFKLDWVDNKVYMIIALPVLQKESEETVVLELFKDVTNSMVVETSESLKNNTLIQTLNEIIQLQIKDGLTGIFNRRFIDERLPAEIVNDSPDSYSVIFADIDHFKLVNDTYGHVAGDHVLKKFAELLKNSIRGSNDWVARYGGEEFLIYNRNVDLAQAVEISEKLRKDVENCEFNFEENTIKITSSFGVCSIQKPCNIKVEELIAAVDKNLYAAKESGRNKVVATIYTTPPSP